MKKALLFAATILSAALLVTSCQKPCQSCEEGEDALLTLNLNSPVTKSTATQSEANDKTINTVDVFIFRNNGSTYELDTYQNFSGGDLTSVTLSTTTGAKLIKLIVNNHSASYSSVKNLTEFNKLTTLLKDELLGDFTMYGEASETLGLTNSVSIEVKRFISRVVVNSIKTSFSGTPYEGEELSDCKLYLVNVHGEKIVNNNGNPTSAVILNNGQLVDSDASSTATEDLIMGSISGTIGSTAMTTPHYFYAYSNLTDDQENCTKLVLECTLKGNRYYYPIPINQADYGLATGGTAGVDRNTIYSYTITIKHPGSTDPNEPIVFGAMDISINVADWEDFTFDKTF